MNKKSLPGVIASSEGKRLSEASVLAPEENEIPSHKYGTERARADASIAEPSFSFGYWGNSTFTKDLTQPVRSGRSYVNWKVRSLELKYWYTRKDSNLRPSDPKSDALFN
ncbi:MAG: hypothetical protein QOJ64_1496 [Acidobacteriota bacterium]|nr:hypothetical protein [Acidobacteriota bacterium]